MKQQKQPPSLPITLNVYVKRGLGMDASKGWLVNYRVMALLSRHTRNPVESENRYVSRYTSDKQSRKQCPNLLVCQTFDIWGKKSWVTAPCLPNNPNNQYLFVGWNFCLAAHSSRNRKAMFTHTPVGLSTFIPKIC
jgi:hypothetical protein